MTGHRGDMPAEAFVRALSQLRTSEQTFANTIGPIDYMAPLLEAAAMQFATDLDREREHLINRQGVSENAESFARSWKDLKKSSYMLDGISRSLSNAIQTPEWFQGRSKGRVVRLHREYLALIQLNRSINEHIRDSLQQMSSLQSIVETKKGLQQADSVKR